MKNKNLLVTLFLAAVIMIIFIIQVRTKQNAMTGEDEIHTEADLSMSELNIIENVDNEKIYGNTLDSLYSAVTDTDDNKRSYSSFLGFPFQKGMQFADKEIFETIKAAFNLIDFYGEFEKGNLDVYDYYKEKYIQLIKHQVTFFDKDSNEGIYLNDLCQVQIKIKPEYNSNYVSPDYVSKDNSDYDLDYYSYIFFDMDGGGAPELCITDGIGFHYIFKYIPDTDQFILWCELNSTYSRIMGTKKVYWDRFLEREVFYQLDEKNNAICSVHFFQYTTTILKTKQDEVVYMAALPQYKYENNDTKMTEEMKKQGYFDEYEKVYYYRLTEEQYSVLTEDYFNALDLAKENIKEVTFTYDELFGGLN